MKDSEYDYFDCLRFYDLGKCMFHFLEKLDLAAMDDALNSRAICAMERIGRVLENDALDNDALDNETCLETLRKVARIYQEEMGVPLNGSRFLDARTQRFVRRMQRETGGDEEDWDDPT